MTLPDPKPGLVIRYAFLWSHEQAIGRDEGSKERPCAIVVAVARTGTDEITTIVAPITHTRPSDRRASIELPGDVCRSLGLDHHRQWIRLDTLNRFTWPGFDLRPIPGQPDRYAYGMLPRGLFERLRRGILALQRDRSVRVASRD